MLKQKNKNSPSGFTLLELLTVIAIIGILASILYPAIQKALFSARVAVAQRNLQTIATSYLTYANEGGMPRTINTQNIYEWATLLAQYSDLNDPRIWILQVDPLVAQVKNQFPAVVAKPDINSNEREWTTSKDFLKFPLSFAVANGLSPRASSSTPLVWLRGLKKNGQWSSDTEEKPSPFGSQVGLIAFKDGHVDHFRDSLAKNGGLLVHYSTKERTANIIEALNPKAEILEGYGIKTDDKQ
jgi:prepilin-type N-terminal cleavage/methylation domain-containing protein